MAWLAVDMDGSEIVYDSCPERGKYVFDPNIKCNYVELPKGSIKKLIGRDLTWEDEPVELLWET